MTAAAAAGPLLQIKDLKVDFVSKRNRFSGVRNVSLALPKGKTLALVGESGCGKSVTALAIMGLLPVASSATEGTIRYTMKSGTVADVLQLDLQERRSMYGPELAMIFQEPMTSLNPLLPVGKQIGEVLLLHTSLSGRERRRRVIEMLELVEIPSAATRYDAYPHELSGGMRQRIMIAIAMICNPNLLIADEPTTALDVTIQAQILDLMNRLQTEFGMSILFITHDMGVVAEIADEVAVMYAGEIAEQASVDLLFAEPKHPYTRGLLASIPGPRGTGRQGGRLVSIPGTVPQPYAMPPGCPFAPRCAYAAEECSQPVGLRAFGDGHLVRCARVEQIEEQIPAS